MVLVDGLACVALIGGIGGLIIAGTRADATVAVTVNGRPVRLPASRATVGLALHRAQVVARDGDLFSLVSHRRLVGLGQPAQFLVNGFPETRRGRLDQGSQVSVIPGVDSVEPAETRRIPVPSPGLPAVENQMWASGQPGFDEAEVGQRSGEVAQRVQLVAPGPTRPVTEKVVTLSFDDGPDPRWTPMILQILHDAEVKAVFCIPSYAGEKQRALVKAEFDQGHTMCDHTVHHVIALDKKPHDEVVSEVNGGADFLRAVTGREPLFYRPPGGTLSPDIIDVAHRRGLRVLKWSVDPSDYRRPPAPEVLRRILARVGPGAVILMHDGGGDRSNTVAIVKPLIDALRAQGYTFGVPT